MQCNRRRRDSADERNMIDYNWSARSRCPTGDKSAARQKLCAPDYLRVIVNTRRHKKDARLSPQLVWFTAPRVSAGAFAILVQIRRNRRAGELYRACMFMARCSSHAINTIITYCNNFALGAERFPTECVYTRAFVNYRRRLIECPRRGADESKYMTGCKMYSTSSGGNR